MPYNTRRKSLSLPSLGIQLPNASRAHRSSISKPSVPADTPQPPNKKVKRSHASNSSSPVSATHPPSSAISPTPKTVSFADRPKSKGRSTYDNTPPPSPGASHDIKIDTDEIDDDIVVGVIEQLEKTGNRPHLIRELSTVLSTINKSILGSTNPTALLSSRLSNYLRRPSWNTQSPCPLGKELTDVHPRKVYYFLTTSRRQSIPADGSNGLPSSSIHPLAPGGKGGKRVISPSISNASVDDDAEVAERKRDALSPSPEVDLSTHDLDADANEHGDNFTSPPTPAGSSFSARSSLARDGSSASSESLDLTHNHRAASPPLEGDEREFTQTASIMRMRGMSLDELNIRPSTENIPSRQEEHREIPADETEEERAKRNQEAVATLFGEHHQHTQTLSGGIMSSPVIKSMDSERTGEKLVGDDGLGDVEMGEPESILGDTGFGLTWDTREPENIQLDELDDLFGAI